MQTIIDISDSRIQATDQLTKGVNESYKLAFGLLKDKLLDSLAYQQELRDEWR